MVAEPLRFGLLFDLGAVTADVSLMGIRSRDVI